MKSRINQLIGQINQEEFEQKEDIKGRRGNQPQQLCFRHRPPSSEILRRGEKKKSGYWEESQGDSWSGAVIRVRAWFESRTSSKVNTSEALNYPPKTLQILLPWQRNRPRIQGGAKSRQDLALAARQMREQVWTKMYKYQRNGAIFLSWGPMIVHAFQNKNWIWEEPRTQTFYPLMMRFLLRYF